MGLASAPVGARCSNTAGGHTRFVVLWMRMCSRLSFECVVVCLWHTGAVATGGNCDVRRWIGAEDVVAIQLHFLLGSPLIKQDIFTVAGAARKPESVSHSDVLCARWVPGAEVVRKRPHSCGYQRG